MEMLKVSLHLNSTINLVDRCDCDKKKFTKFKELIKTNEIDV